MESKSFRQFLNMMEGDKANLVQISQYKKAHETEYETYNTAYKKALDECQKAHNAGIKGYEGFGYRNKENIMKQIAHDSTIPYPELKYDEAVAKAEEIKARNARIQNGTATSADFMSIKSELYGRG